MFETFSKFSKDKQEDMTKLYEQMTNQGTHKSVGSQNSNGIKVS